MLCKITRHDNGNVNYQRKRMMPFLHRFGSVILQVRLKSIHLQPDELYRRTDSLLEASG
nr:MAG TPA: hypothetical protein [Caudoviricetes sp.]